MFQVTDDPDDYVKSTKISTPGIVLRFCRRSGHSWTNPNLYQGYALLVCSTLCAKHAVCKTDKQSMSFYSWIWTPKKHQRTWQLVRTYLSTSSSYSFWLELILVNLSLVYALYCSLWIGSWIMIIALVTIIRIQCSALGTKNYSIIIINIIILIIWS